MPHCHPVERVRYMQKELLHTLKRAKILITDSDFTRNELIEYFNLSPQKFLQQSWPVVMIFIQEKLMSFLKS